MDALLSAAAQPANALFGTVLLGQSLQGASVADVATSAPGNCLSQVGEQHPLAKLLQSVRPEECFAQIFQSLLMQTSPSQPAVPCLEFNGVPSGVSGETSVPAAEVADLPQQSPTIKHDDEVTSSSAFAIFYNVPMPISPPIDAQVTAVPTDGSSNEALPISPISSDEQTSEQPAKFPASPAKSKVFSNLVKQLSGAEPALKPNAIPAAVAVSAPPVDPGLEGNGPSQTPVDSEAESQLPMRKRDASAENLAFNTLPTTAIIPPAFNPSQQTADPAVTAKPTTTAIPTTTPRATDVVRVDEVATRQQLDSQTIPTPDSASVLEPTATATVEVQQASSPDSPIIPQPQLKKSDEPRDATSKPALGQELLKPQSEVRGAQSNNPEMGGEQLPQKAEFKTVARTVKPTIADDADPIVDEVAGKPQQTADVGAELVAQPLSSGSTNTRDVQNRSQAVDERPAIRNIAERLSEAVLTRAPHEGRNSFEVKLDPPELGSVWLKVTSTRHGLDARLVVENASTRQLIENNVASLRDSMRDAGVSLQQFDVSQQSGSQPDWREPQQTIPFRPASVQSALSNNSTSASRNAGGPSSSAIDLIA